MLGWDWDTCVRLSGEGELPGNPEGLYPEGRGLTAASRAGTRRSHCLCDCVYYDVHMIRGEKLKTQKHNVRHLI